MISQPDWLRIPFIGNGLIRSALLFLIRLEFYGICRNGEYI